MLRAQVRKKHTLKSNFLNRVPNKKTSKLQVSLDFRNIQADMSVGVLVMSQFDSEGKKEKNYLIWARRAQGKIS